MITRFKDKENEVAWTITPRYKIGTIVEIDDNVGGFIIDEIVGIQAWINRLTEGCEYTLKRGNNISEKQIVGTFERSSNGNQKE